MALALTHEYLLPVLVAGSQPAVVVLAIVGAVQWLLQERYRRQLIFMPTFARALPGSTVTRTSTRSSVSRPRWTHRRH